MRTQSVKKMKTNTTIIQPVEVSVDKKLEALIKEKKEIVFLEKMLKQESEDHQHLVFDQINHRKALFITASNSFIYLQRMHAEVNTSTQIEYSEKEKKLKIMQDADYWFQKGAMT